MRTPGKSWRLGWFFWCFRLESTKKSSLPTESDKEAPAANEMSRWAKFSLMMNRWATGLGWSTCKFCIFLTFQLRSWKEFFLEASSDDVAANIIAAWSAGGTAQGLVASFGSWAHNSFGPVLVHIENCARHVFLESFPKKTSFGVRSGECAFRKLSLDFLFMLWKIKACLRS